MEKSTDEENKEHKSAVAKITFKTAREQLLATNPAAKRTLGASRKAQGKFVSPMLGAQYVFLFLSYLRSLHLNKHYKFLFFYFRDKQDSPEPFVADERLKNLDPKMVELIESEIIDKGTPVCKL